ncbi:hypothetical protein FQR65_LT07508 [Abscondita terminalis]|nr:hypothetical protein FQR65_LT07508 [Abscondita terminalis]
MGTLVIYFLGAFVRYWLITSEYQNVIAERIEISTPLNSWKRVTEGLHLLDLDIYPYIGDTLHESPLHLLGYNYLVKTFGSYLHLVFIISDLVTAHLLYLSSKKYMEGIRITQEQNKDKYAVDAKALILSDKDFTLSPIYVAVAYLFNLYTILNCVGMTTTVFGNLFAALFLAALNYGYIAAAIPLAFCISQNFYPVLLLSPLFLHFAIIRKSYLKATSAVLLCIICWSFITYLCFSCYGRWDFIENTYGFILSVSDLRPNIGLFWYFFIEMFEHFRSLFIYSFQINVTILYLIPLSIRFRNDPMLLSTSLLSLTAIFKSYPCLGDIGFVLSLYPCWKHLFSYVQQGFLVSCCFLVTTLLGPTVWYLWIYSGSANANFYFGVTLAFATAQIFLITDILFSYTKREFSLIYGRIRKLNSKNAQLILE